MHKITFSGSKGLLLNYIVRVILLTVISIGALSSAFSYISLKIDLDEKYFQYISVLVVSLSSIIISYFSVKPFKNNGLAMGAISVLPLIIYSLVNLICCNNSIVFFAVKLLLMLILGAVFGSYSIKKRKKIRVK